MYKVLFLNFELTIDNDYQYHIVCILADNDNHPYSPTYLSHLIFE